MAWQHRASVEIQSSWILFLLISVFRIDLNDRESMRSKQALRTSLNHSCSFRIGSLCATKEWIRQQMIHWEKKEEEGSSSTFERSLCSTMNTSNIDTTDHRWQSSICSCLDSARLQLCSTSFILDESTFQTALPCSFHRSSLYFPWWFQWVRPSKWSSTRQEPIGRRRLVIWHSMKPAPLPWPRRKPC